MSRDERFKPQAPYATIEEEFEARTRKPNDRFGQWLYWILHRSAARPSTRRAR